MRIIGWRCDKCGESAMGETRPADWRKLEGRDLCTTCAAPRRTWEAWRAELEREQERAAAAMERRVEKWRQEHPEPSVSETDDAVSYAAYVHETPGEGEHHG